MQTKYELYHDAAFAGMAADLRHNVDESYSAEGAIAFGRGVVAGTDPDRQVKVPTTGGGVFRGIARHQHISMSPANAPAGYPDKSTVNTFRRGSIWVEVVDAVTRDTPVYMVNTGANAGRFAAAASDTAGAVATASPGNVGNGTMGTITVTAPPARGGDYTLEITAEAEDAGTFVVRDPDGVEIGTGTVGVAFNSGGLAFTLADGSTDFAVGDAFTLNVDVTFSADLVPTAVFRSSTTGEGLALVELNMP